MAEHWRWPEWAEEFLRAHYQKKGISEIAKDLSRIAGREVGYYAVRMKARALGLTDKKAKKVREKFTEEDMDFPY